MTPTFDPFDPGKWADQPGCEAFEIALTMRARGALAPSAMPVLEAHLEACDSCRDFGDRVGRVEAVLANHATTEPVASPAWQRIHQKLSTQLSSYRRRMSWTFVGLMAFMFGAYIPLSESLDPRPFSAMRLVIAGLASVGFSAAMFYAMYLHGVRKQRRLLEEPDIVGAYRDQLERRVRLSSQFLPVYGVLLAGGIYLALDDVGLAIDGDSHARFRLFKMGFQVALLFFVVAASMRERVRARRELAELH